ncbi:hypothetical protein QUB08_29265 [Microcoleus sp. BR0-C5]|uniref:hypothetical protein n=1 Tax=Microcoleus sp. BR0-C5 TaxID=2818713 RepID=UPI002FCEB786
MTNPTASEIVFAHVHSNPEAFLVALESVPPETKKAVLDYMQTSPKIGEEPEQTNPTEETK